MIATLTTLFGLLGLVLAAVGLCGVLAYLVERRTGESGVRIAALLASVIPAWRAASVEPMMALRTE